MIFATVDFPEPDSPTIANVSPFKISKETFLTALIIFRGFKILPGSL